MNTKNQESLTFRNLRDALEGNAALSTEQRSDGISATACHAQPAAKRVAYLLGELGQAHDLMGRYEDQLVTKERELVVKQQEVAALQQELAAAKKQLGITPPKAVLPEKAEKEDLVIRQKEVIDVLDSLVQEGNAGFLALYEVIDPIKQLLEDEHSVILSRSTSHGESLMSLTKVVTDYIEKYQLSLIEVDGRLS